MHRPLRLYASALWFSLLAGCTNEGAAVRPSNTRAALSVPGLFFQGDNFSGAERGFGAALEENWGQAIPGIEGTTFTWPTPAGNMLPAGMNIVRLPFQWERLQPTLNENFDPPYLAKLHSTAEAWRNLGATVVLDVHNYAYYKVTGRGTTQPGQHLGSSEVPSAALADLWRRLALEFGSASTSSPFIFGLMNEPHDLDVATWVDAAQRAVDAIRATGAKNMIFVPGADWTTASDFSWSENNTLLQAVTDPANNFAIEVHQYYDGTCTPTCYVDKLKPFEDWAVANQRSAYLGELDVTDATDACHEAFSNLIDHLHAKAAGTAGGVWVGYTYWQGTGIADGLPFIAPHLPATCVNGAKDGTETDQDCGATCLRCRDTKACSNDYDCQSGFCTLGACSSAGVSGAGGATGATGGTAGTGGVGTGGATTGGTGGTAMGGTAMGGMGMGGTNESAAGADARGSAGMTSHGGNLGSGGASGSVSASAAGADTTLHGGASGLGAGGAALVGGNAGRPSAERSSNDDASSGCGCRVGTRPAQRAWLTSVLLLPLLRRRRRRAG